MKNAHILVFTTDFLPSLEAEARQEFEAGDTWWTCNRHVRAGDTLYFYVCGAGQQKIVAVGLVASDAERNGDPSSIWFGGWMCEVEAIEMLEKPITRLALCDAFPEWRYWVQPRTSVRVPAAFVAGLEMLLKGGSKEK